MEAYDFLVPGPPVSTQTKDREARRRWKERVQAAAVRATPHIPVFWDPGVRLTIVHLHREKLFDVDNLIKPIQDGLELTFYVDDVVVTDVDSHRRALDAKPDAASLPELLRWAWGAGEECVYVRVQYGVPLEAML
ncbi:MAG TPA: RusA family crossover junction endodeoxyribonuclease [Longimicrobium sp.]|nr:RusA family crossover junction endodeoxyribonuclease [Longimicrobium sp.]